MPGAAAAPCRWSACATHSPSTHPPRRLHGLPTRAARRGHVWTWDFVSDATMRGGPLKMLTILDEFTRDCHMLRPERALQAADVLAWLERAIKEHGASAFLRSDNGPEFIAEEVQRWLVENRIKTIYIDPGSPWQNGFMESFHGRFCDECLNQEQLWMLTKARVVVTDFRHHYNHSRPHDKLGHQSPACFAAHNPRPSSLVEAGKNNSPMLAYRPCPRLIFQVARNGESRQTLALPKRHTFTRKHLPPETS